MGDEYRQRMMRIADELQAQGVPRSTAAPPFYRLAWRIGLQISPPLYQSFLSLALGFGIWFAVAWGLLMWFAFWESQSRSITSAVVASVFAGVLFGMLMAVYYRRKARKLRLPPIPGE